MNMDRAIMAKARKQIHSMQAPSQINASGGGDVPEVAVQLTEHAASTQQPRPAVNVQQSSPPAADQQPCPSRLSAADPAQSSTTFPQWSESDMDEYTHNPEDEILLAPGQNSGLSSSSSDEKEVNTVHYNMQSIILYHATKITKRMFKKKIQIANITPCAIAWANNNYCSTTEQ